MSTTPVASAAPDRVSTLELFFDLVFVFTVTQVTHVLVGMPNPSGLARASLELGVICWMYGGYAWLTNSAGPDTWQRRILLLVGMAAFFLCALGIPLAFEADALLFGIGYLLVNLVHLCGFWLRPGRTSLRAIYRLAPWNLTSSGLVLAAAFTPHAIGWLLWVGALAVQLLTPLFSRAGADDGFAVNSEHFAERHGLMILIILGESLVSVAQAAAHGHVELQLVLGVLAGLACCAAMWWAYFVDEDTRAAHAFEHSPPSARVTKALTGYGLAHAAMIYGVIGVAAGTQLSVDTLLQPTSAWAAGLLGGGAALYLLGGSGLRLTFGHGAVWPRAVGALLCLLALPASVLGSAAAALLAIALVIAVTLGLERRADAARPAR